MDADVYQLQKLFRDLQGSEIPEDYGYSRDELDFYLWELKFLFIFLRLQSYAFTDGCSLVDVTQKMNETWKIRLHDVFRGPFPEQDKEFIKAFTMYELTHPKADIVNFYAKSEIWKTKLESRAKYSPPEVPIPLFPANYKDDHITTPDPFVVMDFIDGVVENLNILMQIDDPSSSLFVPGPKDQIEELLKELKVLRFFGLFVLTRCKEPQNRHIFVTHVLIEASHTAMVAWLYFPSHGYPKIDLVQHEMNALLSDLLTMKIKAIQPLFRKIYVDVLLDLKSTIQPGLHLNIQLETPPHKLEELPTVSNPSGVVSVNDQMAILQDMCDLLRAHLIPIPILNLESCLQEIDTVVVDAGLLIYTLYDIKGDKEGTPLQDMNKALCLHLPSNIQPVKAMIYIIIRKAFQCDYLLSGHELDCVSPLLNKLRELQAHYLDSLASIMNQLQIIQKELESIQPFLKDIVRERRFIKQDRDEQWSTLDGKACQVEYIIASCIRKEIPQWCLEYWLSDIIEEISTLVSAEIEVRKMEMLNPVPRMNEDLSELKSVLLKTAELDLFSNSTEKDHVLYFLWELRFLDSFLGLQRFAFFGDCGLLDFAQKMQETWMSPEPDSDADAYSDVNADVPPKAKQIWKTKLHFRANYSVPEIPIPANMDDDIPTPNFVMEFIEVLEENLNALLQNNDPSSLFFGPGPKDHIEEVSKELKLLRLFVLFVSTKCTERHSQHIFFTHVLLEASHVAMIAWLYLPIRVNRSQDLALSELKALFSDLLQMKMKPIYKIYFDVLQSLKPTRQPEWHPFLQNKDSAYSGFVETPTNNLVELPSTVSNPNGVVSLIDQMTILQETRNLLRTYLILLPDRECLQEVDIVIVDAGLLIYSQSDINGEQEGTPLEIVNQALCLDLRCNIQPVKAIIHLIIQVALQFNYLPGIHGLGSVDLLLNKLREFQGFCSASLASIKNQLQVIQKELESMQPFLLDVAKEQRYTKHGRLQHWAIQLNSKAYEVEYVIDACIRREVPWWFLEYWLSVIIEEITHVRAEVEIQKNKMLNPIPHDTMDTTTAQIPSRLAETPRMTKEIVGFEEVRKDLRDKLIKGCRQLDVLAIVGMPGLGKTTLAKQLYSDESVVAHFDIRAQCCVSQVYERKDLLLAIVRDATGESPSCSIDEGDVASRLRKTLMAKRYLILVDDVWEASAWDDLSSCFCDAKNGSRIILTTRHLEVASHATSVSKPIPLRMFNDIESWKLLEAKVFGKESCSRPLKEVGQQIAKKCGGLPLSIVLVAGILEKTEKKEECWKQVATSLESHVNRGSEAIVEQSYLDLPCHLKACFLYFAAFPEDKVIDVSRLSRLWISEAFIKGCDGKSMEDIAEGYLENLIGRNLVMASKRAYLDGKVKACRIHDVLLEFCKKKATEKNFLLCIKRDQEDNPDSRIYFSKRRAQPRLIFCIENTSSTHEGWDLSGPEANVLEKWSSSCSFVGSVFFWPNKPSFRSFAISGILQNFKFLKVLHLDHRDVLIDSFPTNLVHLRYFSASTSQKSIPSSISNLWNLETLIFKGDEEFMLVPITVWKMVKLRHLHLTSRGSFRFENAEILHEDSSELRDLQTLSAPYFSCVEDVQMMLRKTPNLLELECNFEDVSSREYPVLDFPARLEKLHIFPTAPHRMFPVCISAPNLKELRVSDFRMSSQHLSNIAQLQTLQALQLTSVNLIDENWEVRDDEFPQLKVFKLLYCNSLKEWTVSDDAFPNLERLILRECDHLKEIPSCFEDISSLKSIKVVNCNESVYKSARDIGETQVENYQNTDFKLFIKETGIRRNLLACAEDCYWKFGVWRTY